MSFAPPSRSQPPLQRSRGQAGERRGTPSAGRAGGWARTDTHRGGTAPAKGLGQIFKSFLEQEGLTGPERVVLARGDLGDRPSGTSGPAPCSSDPLLASLPMGGRGPGAGARRGAPPAGDLQALEPLWLPPARACLWSGG